jgi:hypothetical protein
VGFCNDDLSGFLGNSIRIAKHMKLHAVSSKSLGTSISPPENYARDFQLSQ